MFNLTVKILGSNQPKVLQATAETTIQEVINNIKDSVNFPEAEIRVLHRGNHLDPAKTLAEYQITSDSSVNVVRRRQSGSGRSPIIQIIRRGNEDAETPISDEDRPFFNDMFKSVLEIQTKLADLQLIVAKTSQSVFDGNRAQLIQNATELAQNYSQIAPQVTNEIFTLRRLLSSQPSPSAPENQVAPENSPDPEEPNVSDEPEESIQHLFQPIFSPTDQIPESDEDTMTTNIPQTNLPQNPQPNPELSFFSPEEDNLIEKDQAEFEKWENKSLIDSYRKSDYFSYIHGDEL